MKLRNQWIFNSILATEETKNNDVGDRSIKKYPKESTEKNIICKKMHMKEMWGTHDICTFCIYVVFK